MASPSSESVLFLSFWDITLENVPPGTFQHTQLPADAAVERIRAAKSLGPPAREELKALNGVRWCD